MRFHVGPYTYRLILSDGRLFDVHGDEKDGMAIEGPRLLLLSSALEPERRSEVAYHEYMHAWEFHVPTPRDEEERCNLGAMVRGQFQADLNAAGGEDALLAMKSTMVGDIGKFTGQPCKPLPTREIERSDYMTCGTCQAAIACGEINHGQPVLHEPTRRHRIERWFACESCGAVQVWWEHCTEDGTPLGEFVVVPKPKILRGQESEEWLRRRSLSLFSF